MQTLDTSWDISQTETQLGYGVPHPETSTRSVRQVPVLPVRVAHAKSVILRLVRIPQTTNVQCVAEATKLLAVPARLIVRLSQVAMSLRSST